ncbi:MAG: PDZ domain-containing protein [Bryobacteraceae bacterium]
MLARLSKNQFVALLAGIAALILVVGVLIKPEKAPDVTSISQAEMQRLQTLTQRRNLENLAVYFAQIAASIQPGLVWIEEWASTGVVWNGSGLILTAGSPRFSATQVSAITTSGHVSLAPQMVSSRFSAAAMRAPPSSSLEPVRKGDAQRLDPGIWILLVSRQEGGQYLFTPGTYSGLALTRCGEFEYAAIQSSLPLTEGSVGGGLFDLEGNLLAMVLRCNGGLAAVTPEGVDGIVAEANSPEGQAERRFGIRVAELDETSRAYFKLEGGLLVTEVVDDLPADTAGLAPGDVIVGVDGNPVDLRSSWYKAVLPAGDEKFELQVQRNRKRVKIQFRAKSWQSKPAGGVSISGASEGYEIRSVTAGSRASRASILRGDRIVSIDNEQPGNPAAVREALSDENPNSVFLVLRRGSARYGVFLK